MKSPIPIKKKKEKEKPKSIFPISFGLPPCLWGPCGVCVHFSEWENHGKCLFACLLICYDGMEPRTLTMWGKTSGPWAPPKGSHFVLTAMPLWRHGGGACPHFCPLC